MKIKAIDVPTRTCVLYCMERQQNTSYILLAVAIFLVVQMSILHSKQDISLGIIHKMKNTICEMTIFIVFIFTLILF